jgi:acyl-CoA synthetase (AMP-forming)/AMP-acid ligase II/acyl carrier protein
LRADRTLSRLQAIASDCGATLALGTAESVGWLRSGLLGRMGLQLALATEAWTDWVSLPWTPPTTEPDDVALLQYTSGSTSTPRGVMVTHHNLWHQMANMRVADSAAAVGVSWLPLYHDLGLIGGLVAPIAFRRRVVFMSPLMFVQRPLRWLLALARYQATTTGAPNFAFDLCVSKFAAAEAPGLDLSSLRVILTGAEPIRPDTLDRFARTFAPHGLRPDVWWPGYGLAEATLGVTGCRSAATRPWADFSSRALEFNRAVPLPAEPGSSRCLAACGEPLEGTEVVIVDPASRTALPAGHVGEVWVRGANVGRGYWNRPDETEAVFHACLADSGDGPFLRTGDLGFLHEGQLYLTGRLKEVMIFWGRNVYPQDVEKTTWSCHAALKENGGAAFAIAADGAEQLVVVQEISRPGKVDLEALAESVRQAILAEHLVPLSALVFIKPGTLPKTSSGKIQRAEARERFLSNNIDVVQQWRFPSVVEQAAAIPAGERHPRTTDEIRGWLTNRLARQCGISGEQLDPHERLSHYVRDSLSAVCIALELQQWLGIAVAPTVLYDNPTLAALSARLAELQGLTSTPPGSVNELTAEEVDRALAEFLDPPNA